jgi:hypothetical protein
MTLPASFSLCAACGDKHSTPKYNVGDRVKALAMQEHILRDNPFADPTADRTGHEGVVVCADSWASIGSTLYLVNFNPDKTGPWFQAPFYECQLALVAEKS